jgi:hypothetical protein
MGLIKRENQKNESPRSKQREINPDDINGVIYQEKPGKDVIKEFNIMVNVYRREAITLQKIPTHQRRKDDRTGITRIAIDPS